MEKKNNISLDKESVTKKVLECVDKYQKTTDLYKALQNDKELQNLWITIDSLTDNIVQVFYKKEIKWQTIKKQISIDLWENLIPQTTRTDQDSPVETVIEPILPTYKVIGKIDIPKKEKRGELPQKISIPLEKIIGGRISNSQEFQCILNHVFSILHNKTEKKHSKSDPFWLDDWLKNMQTDSTLKAYEIHNLETVPCVEKNQIRLLRLNTNVPWNYYLQLCSKGLYDKIEGYCQRLQITANSQNIRTFMKMFGDDPWDIIY